MDSQRVANEAHMVLTELIDIADLHSGDLVIIGCSTSEILGENIGTSGSGEIAAVLYEVFYRVQMQSGIVLAFQCCEHLNRAVVLHAEDAISRGLEMVHVIPKSFAGGAMAAEAYAKNSEAVVVESLKSLAVAGLDIGETMIGMHMRPVVVPVRLKQRSVGNARVNAGYSRAKLIGGSRAVY